MFVIISKPNCPWCDKAKKLLTDEGLKFHEVATTEHRMLRPVMIAGGLTTVPQVFMMAEHGNYEHIGGYTELEKHLNG